MCRSVQDDSDLAYVALAKHFAMLAEPTRLRILYLLRDQELNVGALAQQCHCSQANISRHLHALTQHGMLRREARGNTVYYQAMDSSVYVLCTLACDKLSQQSQQQAALFGAVRPGAD
ncbi:winged helix-turn-helix transcriptional regulator [Undibacterium oligocarboniphilum]|uniref:Winged helix-turn-helix transcriptional regulator n=2 Tax=Undibacterium oligocarboniphilum TaxID=666702 RepID=A0A850QIS0_9BURK|nr:metalloregulator ArsR/SmtB family transcription factor [Undibacterium oligocarboniphilum]MBC3869690.1 winged helix-turn-helix transcriptional regulator [Undibacterium oligocarboniphilum]NVO77293.1 winged helix-turn-helix transcriptional regulator [Undibacterium oligocarboniphilum]